MAKKGNPTAASLPRPFKGKDHADFSFAGLKTAVARAYDASDKSDKAKADICASFQHAVCDVLTERTAKAMSMFRKPGHNEPQRFVIAGGVAANKQIRAALDKLCAENNFSLIAPPLKFCTDNAAMIALAGAEHYVRGEFDDFDVKARPRWPLDATAAQKNPASGFGKKGPKS